MNKFQSWALKALGVNRITNNPLQNTAFFNPNRGITIYSYGKDQTFIDEGYSKNAWVYSIVSKCAKKFSQVPWYHYKIKTSERKAWFDEYIPLTKNHISDVKARNEARRIRTKAIDQQIVDSPLTKLLMKPNRNQSGAQFREYLYGFKLLTGEGNIFLSRNEAGDRPKELFVIPKANIAIVRGSDRLADIQSYVMNLAGDNIPVEKDSLIMWAFPNYHFDPTTLEHLRGQAPLDAGLLLMQASNEAAERTASMNKNQGVAGLAYNKNDNRVWTAEQAWDRRRQFNAIINDNQLAGTIANMTGDWGYIQFGMDAVQLKLLEQSEVHFKALCNIFDAPWQLFGNSDSYENRKQYKRDFVYDNIAVAAYSLRDELNAKLLREFDLDRDRDVIDCDIMALPELTEDLKSQAEALNAAWGLSVDDRLIAMGYDAIGGKEGALRLIPANLVPLDQVGMDLGGDLNNEIDLLGE